MKKTSTKVLCCMTVAAAGTAMGMSAPEPRLQSIDPGVATVAPGGGEPAPRGATGGCYTVNPYTCSVMTAADCTAIGGTYLGNNVPCPDEPVVNCTLFDCQTVRYPRVGGTSPNSSGPTFTVADHFRTNSSPGSLSEVCFWGTYTLSPAPVPFDCNNNAPPASYDNFRISIFARSATTGVPITTAPVAAFEQNAATLTVTRRLFCDTSNRILCEYTATFAPLALSANTCYFLEIRNLTNPPPMTTVNWFWPPSLVTTDGVCLQDTNGDSTSPTDPDLERYELSEQLSMVGTLGGDRAWCVNAGVDLFDTTLCLPPPTPPPDNDECSTAMAISGPTSTPFSTSSATTGTDGQNNAACAENYYLPSASTVRSIFKDVWYRWTAAAPGHGAGDRINARASMCGGLEFDAKMAVYAGGTCPPPESSLLNCNDDHCEVAQGISAILSSVEFVAIVGQEYLIQLGGAGSAAGDVGTLTVTVGDATGACCIPGGCVEVTATQCAALSGTYNGDDSDCGATYSFTTGTTAVENISATGTVLAGLRDDTADIAPIGFTFYFYNEPYTEVRVATNGQLVFNSYVWGFANSWAIPMPLVQPNRHISPLWDDFQNVEDGGDGHVYYQTLGTAPNRRFVVLWDAIGDCCGGTPFNLSTFEAILYEGSNNIEFRYGAFDPVPNITPVGNLTARPVIGLESYDGSNSLAIPYRNEVQAFGFPAGTDNNTFRLTVNGVTTGDIQYNSSGTTLAPNIIAAIQAAISGSAVTWVNTGAAGTVADPIRLEFSGSLGFINLPLSTFTAGSYTGPAVITPVQDGARTAQPGVSVSITPNSDPSSICPTGPACPCDFNNDSLLNSQDYFDFLTCFFGGGCPAGQDADYNNDTLINSQDYFDFLVCFFAPPPGCP